jgi:RimJ/RimL family protein N-acetyltransferase
MLDPSGRRVKIGSMPLRLVPVSMRHVRDIQSLAADENVARWMPGPAPDPRDGSLALAFVERAQRLRARGARETFAVCEDDRLLGIAALARDEEAPDRAELGYWIGRAYRGRGYATAAAGRLLAHGFERLHLILVFARCFSTNRASIRVLDKLGLHFVGLEPSHNARQSAEPVRRYELTRAGWQTGAGRLVSSRSRVL